MDPYGSDLALPVELNKTDVTGYHVEGIGYDFIPDALDRDLIDSWVKVHDKTSIMLSKRLIRSEGLLCGGSFGSVVEGCFKYLRDNGLDKNKDIRCVLILPDGIRNYLTKMCADEWMVKVGYSEPSILENKDHPLYGKTCKDLTVKKIAHYDDRFTINEAADAFENGVVAIPLIEKGKIKGIVSRDSLLHGVMKKGLKNSNSASKAMTKDVVIVPYDTDLTAIYALLQKDEIVFVEKRDSDEKVEAIYPVTKLELLKLFRSITKELIY